MSYVRSSIRYLQRCIDVGFSRNDQFIPLPDGYSRPLSITGPPLDPWVTPCNPSAVFRLMSAPLEDLDFQSDTTFLEKDDA